MVCDSEIVRFFRLGSGGRLLQSFDANVASLHSLLQSDRLVRAGWGKS